MITLLLDASSISFDGNYDDSYWLSTTKQTFYALVTRTTATAIYNLAFVNKMHYMFFNVHEQIMSGLKLIYSKWKRPSDACVWWRALLQFVSLIAHLFVFVKLLSTPMKHIGSIYHFHPTFTHVPLLIVLQWICHSTAMFLVHREEGRGEGRTSGTANMVLTTEWRTHMSVFSNMYSLTSLSSR